MRITVSVGSGIAGFAARVAALPVQARRAMVQGLNEGGDLERTDARRNLKGQTGVKRYGAIVSRTKSRRAHDGDLAYHIDGLGKGMPIQEFPVSAAKRGPVTAKPWAVVHRFKRSFRTSGKGLLRARIGANRMPIRALYGPAVSKEIVQGETVADFQGTAAARVERTVMKRIVRLMP